MEPKVCHFIDDLVGFAILGCNDCLGRLFADFLQNVVQPLGIKAGDIRFLRVLGFAFFQHRCELVEDVGIVHRGISTTAFLISKGYLLSYIILQSTHTMGGLIGCPLLFLFVKEKRCNMLATFFTMLPKFIFANIYF